MGNLTIILTFMASYKGLKFKLFKALNVVLLGFLLQTLLSGCTKDNASVNPAPVASSSAAATNVALPIPQNAVVLSAGNNNTDYTIVLQNAINSGKPVYLQSGTFNISKPITKNSGTLSISGNNAIIKLEPSFPNGSGNFSGAFVFSNLTSLTVNGITIDGNRANLQNAGSDWTNYIMGIQVANSQNIKIKNTNIKNAPSISFDFQSSNVISIDSCSSTNGMYHGISFSFCNNGTVINTQIIGIGNQGTNTQIGGIGIGAGGGNNFLFKNNLIENMSDCGTKTEGCNYVTWDGNNVINSGKDGIKFQNRMSDTIYGEADPNIPVVYHGSIINNTVNKIYNGRNDGSSLIQVLGAEDVEVTGNIIIGGSKTGYEDGITAWSNTATPATGINISNNTITNTNRFISLSLVSNTFVGYNNCQNKIPPKTQYNGFEADMSSNISVKHNSFQRSNTGVIDGFAAQLFGCSSFSFTSNSLTNAYSALAVTLASAKADSITNNTMDNFSSYGINISANAAGTTVNSLLLSGNTISRLGMTVPLGWMFKINPANMTINNLDLSNDKIIGNGNSGDYGITIEGSKTISNVNLTNFYCSGNAIYPTLTALTACIAIKGLNN
jgi:hypothetical protein